VQYNPSTLLTHVDIIVALPRLIAQPDAARIFLDPSLGDEELLAELLGAALE